MEWVNLTQMTIVSTTADRNHCIYYCKQESLRRNGVAIMVNKRVCNAGDLSLIPELGRFFGEGNSYLLQYSDLENSMDCIVHESQRVWT